MLASKGCGHGKGKASSSVLHVSLAYGNVESPLRSFVLLVHLCLVSGSHSPLASH